MRVRPLAFWPWLLAVALAAAMLRSAWPEPSHLVPGPYGGVDAVFQTGLLGWTARWWTTPDVWRIAPVFFPATDALWSMDTLLGQGILVTPLLLAGAPPALLYDLALLFSLLLAAGAAGLLWRAAGGRSPGAGLMGLAVLAAPYTTSQLGHLNQLPPPLVLLAAAATALGIRRRRRRWLAAGLLLWALQPAMGWYGLVNGALLLAGVLVVAGRDFLSLLRGRRGVALLLVAAAAVSLVAWQARPYTAAARRNDQFARSLREVRWYSADLKDLLDAGPYRARPADWLGRGARDPDRSRGATRHVLHPGWLVLALALAGLSLRRDLPVRHRRLGDGLLVAGVAGLILAFGDSAAVPGSGARVTLPWGWLWHHVPPLRAYRAVCRFAWPLSVALAWWAAVAWERLALSRRPRLRGAAALLALLLALEGVPMGIPAVRVPAFPVRDTPAPDLTRPLLSLPAVDAEEHEDVAEATWWLAAEQLGRPVTGGVSGRVPPPTRRLRRLLAGARADTLPAAEVLPRVMGELGISEIVTPPLTASGRTIPWWQAWLQELDWPSRREGEWLIWGPAPAGGTGGAGTRTRTSG